MQLKLDDNTGQLTLTSADRAAKVLRAAATVEKLLVVTGQLAAVESVAESLEQHAAAIEGEDSE